MVQQQVNPLDCYPTVATAASIEGDTEAQRQIQRQSLPQYLLWYSHRITAQRVHPVLTTAVLQAESSGPWWCRVGVDWGCGQYVKWSFVSK